MLIDKYKVIKKLGSGLWGTVYLVKDGRRNKALKVTKISELHTKKSLEHSIWREIDFASKYKNNHHFMHLYDYNIIDNCKHKQPIKSQLDNYRKERIHKLNKSKWCSILLYDVKDDTLDNIIDKLNKKQLYSMTIQIIYALYQMNSKGYYHRDVDFDNIAYVKTKRKTIKVFNYDVPTFGYIFSLIDYGNILHDKYLLDAPDRKKLKFFKKHGSDVKLFSFILSNYEEVFKLITHKKIIRTPYDEAIKNINKLPEYEIIRKYTKVPKYEMFLLAIINKQQFAELRGLKSDTSYNKYTYYIDRNDLFYMFIHSNDHRKIIKHLINSICENC